MNEKRFEKSLRKICKEADNPAAMMVRLEKTWRDGFDFNMGKSKIDGEFIIHRTMLRTTVVPLKNAVWAFKNSEEPTEKSVIVSIALDSRLKSYDVRSLSLAPAAADMMLGYIWENCPDIAIGFDEQLNEFYFDENYEELRKHAHTQRKENVKYARHVK